MGDLDGGLKDEVPYPEKNLLVWALLINRIDIARIFWRIGEVKK
jgi:hypothetical protein